MPRRSRRLAKLSDDDEFETEIFKEFNPEKTKETRSKRVESDSDDDDSDLGGEEEPESSDEDKAALSGDEESDDDILCNADEPNKDSDNEGDDEEPESIGFQDSKMAALSQMQQILADMKKEKAKKKDQQQQIEQRNRTQKANKAKRLKRAAAEADELGDALGLPAMETEDYIPLSSKRRHREVISKQVGLDTVQVLDVAAPAPVKEEVVNFKQQMLFGKHVRRVSTQKMMQQRVKRPMILGKR